MNKLPELPRGISIEDLSYLNLENYISYIAMQGWSIETQDGVDDNPAKVSYTLSRPVDASYGFEEVDKLKESMGIVEEDGLLPGYTLTVDYFSESRPLSQTMREAINPHEDTEAVLVFSFTGFPTARTTDAILELEKAFRPQPTQPKKSLLDRMLGKIGLSTDYPAIEDTL